MTDKRSPFMAFLDFSAVAFFPIVMLQSLMALLVPFAIFTKRALWHLAEIALFIGVTMIPQAAAYAVCRRTQNRLVRFFAVWLPWHVLAFVLLYGIAAAIAGTSMAAVDGGLKGAELKRQELGFAWKLYREWPWIHIATFLWSLGVVAILKLKERYFFDRDPLP